MNAAEIIQSVSIIIAAWSVIIGVNAWRREYVGKRKLELAEEVLSLFYKSRDVIRAIRNPGSSIGEGSTRNASPNETPEEKRIYDQAYVTHERYAKQSELFSKLYSMRYRYMAMFGRDSAKPFDDLAMVIAEILSAADTVVYYWRDQLFQSESESREQRQVRLDKIRQYESIIWKMNPEKDSITPRIEQIVSQIEAKTHPILEPDLRTRIRQWFI